MSADLVAFYRARLDEDERVALLWEQDMRRWRVGGARRVFYDNGASDTYVTIKVEDELMGWDRIHVLRDVDGVLVEHIARHDPARVLREVAAKRAIVDAWVELRADLKRAGLGSDMRDWGHLEGLAEAMRLLASAYADHPDYREEWRP